MAIHFLHNDFKLDVLPLYNGIRGFPKLSKLALLAFLYCLNMRMSYDSDIVFDTVSHWQIKIYIQIHFVGTYFRFISIWGYTKKKDWARSIINSQRVEIIIILFETLINIRNHLNMNTFNTFKQMNK